MWSGGIDSTVALVALLKALPGNELDRLTVYLSSHSIAGRESWVLPGPHRR